MRSLALVLLTGCLLFCTACPGSNNNADAGPTPPADSGVRDSGTNPPDSGLPDGGTPPASRLDRPGLPRPPTGGLPAELRPPR